MVFNILDLSNYHEPKNNFKTPVTHSAAISGDNQIFKNTEIFLWLVSYLMMASDDIADVTKKLEGTKVDEKNLLSFKGKGLKLNKPEDGKFHFFPKLFLNQIS